jgi:hypothetical protein
MPKRKKTQNQLLCQLYVKNQLYDELKRFKAQQKLPREQQMTIKQKWTIINELINNTPPAR